MGQILAFVIALFSVQSAASPGLHFQIVRKGPPICEPSHVIRIPLDIEVDNPHSAAAVLGRIRVIQESFYHKSDKGALHLVRQGPYVEEFLVRDRTGYYGVTDRRIEPGERAKLSLEAVFVVNDRDIQTKGKKRFLTIIFLLSNMKHNGSAQTYAIGPTTIELPVTCNTGLH